MRKVWDRTVILIKMIIVIISTMRINRDDHDYAHRSKDHHTGRDAKCPTGDRDSFSTASDANNGAADSDFDAGSDVRKGMGIKQGRNICSTAHPDDSMDLRLFITMRC